MIYSLMASTHVLISSLSFWYLFSFFQYQRISFSLDTLFYSESVKLACLLLFSLFLAFFIIFLSYSFSVANPDAEKVSAYECGFDPYEDARNVFDVRFYLVAILFLIFDLEAVYFFP